MTNRLSTALTFTGISVPAGGPFNISSNTCGTGIAAGATCTVGVTLTPTALGATNGTLTFADSAIKCPQAVSLSGTGTRPSRCPQARWTLASWRSDTPAPVKR